MRSRNDQKLKIDRPFITNFLSRLSLVQRSLNILTIFSRDLKKSLTIQHYRPNIDMHRILAALKFQDFQEFAKRFTERMYVQFFVQGTMEKSDAIDIVEQCIKTLKCRPLLSNMTPQHSVNEIPRGIHCCRVRSFDPGQVHSYVTNYYQFDEPSLKLTGMIDYLHVTLFFLLIFVNSI